MEEFKTATRWKLDNLQCGFNLDKYNFYLGGMNDKLIELESYSETNILSESDLVIISQLIQQIDSAESFYHCLLTEDVEPSYLSSLNETISTLKKQVYSILSNLQGNLHSMSEPLYVEWAKDVKQTDFLTELLDYAKVEDKISEPSTVGSLEAHYLQVRDSLRIKFDYLNEMKELTFGEAIDLAMSHPAQSYRTLIFQELNKTLEEQANSFASIYNQMVGLRLHEAQIKKVNCLDESLILNGISKQTLDVVWETIDSNLHALSKYFNVKSNKATNERLDWHEFMSPSPNDPAQLTFDQAVDAITKSLESIDSNMSEFVKDAVANGWVDAEPRITKQSGGFCVPFISEGESRISLNFDNKINSARILAHEFGHAWHFKQMSVVPSLRFLEDTLEMTVAETSSIFFETVCIDYLIQNTSDISIKKSILGEKIERSLTYLMSIKGAFSFEERFYECRKSGLLDAEQIEELSLRCQNEAYGGNLRNYEPFVWIKYGQFYQANTPFYNYPYTIGFLLSLGLLDSAKKDQQFDRKFQSFLSETRTVPLEQLMKKHFQIDLSQRSFWQQSLQKIIQDIELFQELTVS
ncbi:MULTISPECIES: M3 family metallopeptidase [unclassified Sporosarcina]|uniref:M3 family metallopeptidase n=2 Tax=Sporosarcina TaxID=1569 RepID=UPI00203E77B1|nr:MULTISPECIES: M3 family metallopeptidase [unclassified Sporosarcina]GKV65816.1 oligoendopeptidase F [Sporosarcina sp. NCCP-2331]GLB55940.1 oligoendopeptidase F [Sporosarcina sp. NCCP-2378]